MTKNIPGLSRNPEKTIVIFRKERGKNPTITAVFPEIPADYQGFEMTCYAHIGQHSACTMSWYNETRPATHEEYKDLLAELESIGYRPAVRARLSRRMNEDRYNAARK